MTLIAIVLHGPTSAGKSSLAKALQDSSSVPAFHISLDAFVGSKERLGLLPLARAGHLRFTAASCHARSR
ncbi:phosphotransferase-like protein [Paraburkholderia sp. J41]|uniref:phosphotransferase-like protein n=1 Tax=Paraburkholderia sp. J41 TaxID=2805433 RepID=UPI0039F5A3FC